MKGIKRRTFLGMSAVAAGSAVLGFPNIIRAANKETTILGLFPVTGPYADTGPLMDVGTKLALQEVGYQAGGVKIRYVTRDSETKGGAATRRAEEAIASDGVKIIVGPWSSGVALAVSEVAKNKKVVHYFSGGTEDISGKRCHRYSFQWAANAWTAMNTNLSTIHKADPKIKKLYLFVVDYAFGWSLQKYIENLAPKYQMEVVGVDRHPLGQREFSSYITKAQAANPDAVYMVNFGLDAISAVRQMYNFGMIPRIPVVLSWSAGVEELVQLDPAMRENMYVGTNFYYTVDTPVAKKFDEMYRKQDPHGNPPGYAPGAAYGMTRLIVKAIEKAQSGEPKEVIAALEGMRVNDLVGEEYIVPRNHQTIRPYFALKCKSAKAMKGPYDFADIIDTDATPQPTELNECKDIGSV
jgi:branched-chain amino acid transport system substrate-binding protein